MHDRKGWLPILARTRATDGYAKRTQSAPKRCSASARFSHEPTGQQRGGANVYERGTQLIDYPLQEFESLQLGAELLYVRVGIPTFQGQQIKANAGAVAVGPLVGYKLLTEVGFTFFVQGGLNVPRHACRRYRPNGLMIVTPRPRKCATFLVASECPCARAVAKMNKSRASTHRPWRRAAVSI